MPCRQVVSIYVSIASYRDPLLQSTIDSLFENAVHPDLISVGCFIQAFPADTNCGITNTYGDKVKFAIAIPGNVFSVTSCRVSANQWLNDEAYVLQVDSHSRFDYGWDKTLIEALEGLAETAVLSSYLPGWYPDTSGEEQRHPVHSNTYLLPTFLGEYPRSAFFNSYELVPALEAHEKSPDLAQRSWYICGHFVFSHAKFFKDVLQPSWILFWGEELYYSLLAASYGWEIWTPPKLPIYHLYPQDVPHLSLNKLWKDFPDRWDALRYRSTDLVIDAITARRSGVGYFKEVELLNNVYDFIGYDLGELLDGWRTDYKAIH